MRLKLKSKVNGDLHRVFACFDSELFKYLLPPGAKLITFEGSKKGAHVHLKLPLAGEWLSEITTDDISDDKCYFIDEGRILPFPLKQWKHHHILLREGDDTIIVDDIHFSTGLLLGDLLFYPVLFFSFLPRVWQYKSYFVFR